MHIEKLRKLYSNLLPIEATLVSFTTLAQDVLLIEEDQLRAHGPMDVMIAGWPCQGLSMARNQNGLQDKQSACFHELIRVHPILQKIQTKNPGYIIESVLIILESKGCNLKSVKYIHDVLGPTITVFFKRCKPRYLINATKIGSRAHRLHQWWTNLVPPIVLDSFMMRHNDLFIFLYKIFWIFTDVNMMLGRMINHLMP